MLPTTSPAATVEKLRRQRGNRFAAIVTVSTPRCKQPLDTAEGTGLEPATPCGASDFESDSSPFGYPPGSNVAVTSGADKVRRLAGQRLEIASFSGSRAT